MSGKWLVRERVPNFVDRKWAPAVEVDSKDAIVFDVPFVATWKDTWGSVFDRFEIKPYNKSGEHLVIAYFSYDGQTKKPSHFVVAFCTPKESEMAKNWRYKLNIEKESK